MLHAVALIDELAEILAPFADDCALIGGMAHNFSSRSLIPLLNCPRRATGDTRGTAGKPGLRRMVARLGRIKRC